MQYAIIAVCYQFHDSIGPTILTLATTRRPYTWWRVSKMYQHNRFEVLETPLHYRNRGAAVDVDNEENWLSDNCNNLIIGFTTGQQVHQLIVHGRRDE